VGSVSHVEMLYRTNVMALIGGGSIPRFDEKAGKSLIFSSPGPKVQVNYCHHLASVVCRL
jgi:hypothetical protein